MEVLGRILATALAESSDLLDVADQVATALENLANRNAIQTEHHAPKAGTYSPALEPHLDISPDLSIGMLPNHPSKTGANPCGLAPQGAKLITLEAQHSTQRERCATPSLSYAPTRNQIAPRRGHQGRARTPPTRRH